MTSNDTLPVPVANLGGGGQQHRQCSGKHILPDLQAAEAAARAMEKKTHKSVTYNSYYCRWCHGWHIGRSRTPEQAARRRREPVEAMDDGSEVALP